MNQFPCDVWQRIMTGSGSSPWPLVSRWCAAMHGSRVVRCDVATAEPDITEPQLSVASDVFRHGPPRRPIVWYASAFANDRPDLMEAIVREYAWFHDTPALLGLLRREPTTRVVDTWLQHFPHEQRYALLGAVQLGFYRTAVYLLKYQWSVVQIYEALSQSFVPRRKDCLWRRWCQAELLRYPVAPMQHLVEDIGRFVEDGTALYLRNPCYPVGRLASVRRPLIEALNIIMHPAASDKQRCYYDAQIAVPIVQSSSAPLIDYWVSLLRADDAPISVQYCGAPWVDTPLAALASLRRSSGLSHVVFAGHPFACVCRDRIYLFFSYDQCRYFLAADITELTRCTFPPVAY